MFPILNLGPLSLPASPLFQLIGFWLGSSLAERRAKIAGRNPELLSKLIWTVVVAGILGARLSFIARNPSAFQGEWTSIFSLNLALLDPIGGLAISLAALYFLASKNDMLTWSLLDDLVPLIAVFLPAFYLANFASGSGSGMLTDIPWGVYQWGGYRHPVQLYYLFSSLAVLYLVAIRHNLNQVQPGMIFLSFLSYTSGYLTILYAFQDPMNNLVGGVRVIQFISWVVFTACTFTLYRLKSSEANDAAE